MNVAVVGGGPGGLYSALLLKKDHPEWDVTLFEKNPPGATYGWGVVFSDRTLTSFREADYRSYADITDRFVMWDAIDITYRGQLVRCGGQGFAGISRKALLALLHERCIAVGVEVHFETEMAPDELEDPDLAIAADGVHSPHRDRFADVFGPRLTEGNARYIWYGTTTPLDSFTFSFRVAEHGLFQAHAYPFDADTSTFIVEAAEDVWLRAGLDGASETESIAFCEALFADDLRGHSLMSNASKWIRFITVKNRSWRAGKVVLLGDAAHTAHFSIGSGTKLAMEDAIALSNAFQKHSRIDKALADYELERKPRVERFQEAARQSQTYFEHTGRYVGMAPMQFAFHLLTRSGRVDYNSLRLRDPSFVSGVDGHLATGRDRTAVLAPPPAFVPTVIGPAALGNRIVVEARPLYSASEGRPAQGHRDELRAAAASGAALVTTELLAVSDRGRMTPGCAGLYTDEQAVVWRDILDRLHKEFPAVKVMARIGHAGRRGSTAVRIRASDQPVSGWPVLAPSAIPYSEHAAVPKEMDEVDLADVKEHFARAAVRAAGASFDAVVVDMSRGYLLGSFLSPLTNLRADEYGEDRKSYPVGVFHAVRSAWPADRLLGAAVNGSDWSKGGATPTGAVSVARSLRAAGCDVIEVRAGQTLFKTKPLYNPYYLIAYADQIRNEAGIATLATGAIASPDDANTIVGAGRADLCLLLR